MGIIDGATGALSRAWRNRNVLAFAMTQLHHPQRLLVAKHAYDDGIARQAVLFHTQRVDDVTDAMRHAGTSALLVDRLVDHGTRPSIAARFMRRLGQAHERDSGLGGHHGRASEAMDLHNNDLGISLALDHARRGATPALDEPALEGAVLQALARGRGLVLDSPVADPRPSTVADLRSVLRDPSVV